MTTRRRWKWIWVLALAAAPAFALISPAPAAAEESFEEGMRLKREERFSDAAAVFEKIVRDRPDHADALQQLATLQGWLGRYDASVESWRRLILLHPDNPESRVGLARVLGWKNDPVGAESEYQHAIRIHPNDYDALVGLGDLAARRDAIDEARGYYLRAQAVNPDDEDLKRKLAAAVPPLSWRFDMGYLYDGYSQTRGPEHNLYTQIGRALPRRWGKSSVWVRHEWLRHFKQVDNAFIFGGSVWPIRPVAAQLELGVTPSNDFFADWQANLTLDFPVSRVVVPSINFRHYDYPDGNVQVYAGSLRIQPWTWSAATFQYSASNNISGPNTDGWQAKTEWFWGEDWSAYTGYSQGDESLPPQSTAFNESLFAGILWSMSRQWSLRIDYSHERRPNFYFRNSAGAGVTFKF